MVTLVARAHGRLLRRAFSVHPACAGRSGRSGHPGRWTRPSPGRLGWPGRFPRDRLAYRRPLGSASQPATSCAAGRSVGHSRARRSAGRDPRATQADPLRGACRLGSKVDDSSIVRVTTQGTRAVLQRSAARPTRVSVGTTSCAAVPNKKGRRLRETAALRLAVVGDSPQRASLIGDSPQLTRARPSPGPTLLPAPPSTPSRDRDRARRRSAARLAAAVAVRPAESGRSGTTRSRCRPESVGPS
jgi:hypothetical protein